MKYFLILLTSLLTACATPPQFLANMYDSNDRCQNYYKRADYQQPSYCGAGSGSKYVTRDYTTGRYLTTTKVPK